MIAGGGAPEIELSIKLSDYAKTITGKEAACFKAFAEALEIIPYTLAENAGLSPISIVTELRNRHVNGEIYAGINVRKVCIHFIITYFLILFLLLFFKKNNVFRIQHLTFSIYFLAYIC